MAFHRARTVLLILMALCSGLVAAKASSPSQVAPFQIWFSWGDASAPGILSAGSSVTITDACSASPIAVPEYDMDVSRNNPAAYARGSAVTVRVKWRVSGDPISQATVWATGSLGGFPETQVTFTDGVSDWVEMQAKDVLPNSIGTTQATFDWQYRVSGGAGTSAGATTHTLYTLNRAPLTSPVYLDLVRWTASWCQGLPDDARTIADAILSGFARQGVIKYGYAGWTTHDILCTGGGMCGGMYQVFYDACGTQGVHVARSCYILEDADPSSKEYKWKSMIIYAPGIGNTEPTYPEQTIRQVNTAYPHPKYVNDDRTTDDVELDQRKVYEFFAPGDGHCINFLEHDGKLYLYDLSFGTGPWPGTFDALPDGIKRGEELTGFRDNYMNHGIDYMRGRILYQKKSKLRNIQKLDVKSSIIPDIDTEFQYEWITEP